jgi:hypothetical protein
MPPLERPRVAGRGFRGCGKTPPASAGDKLMTEPPAQHLWAGFHCRESVRQSAHSLPHAAAVPGASPSSSAVTTPPYRGFWRPPKRIVSAHSRLPSPASLGELMPPSPHDWRVAATIAPWRARLHRVSCCLSDDTVCGLPCRGATQCWSCCLSVCRGLPTFCPQCTERYR